MIFSSIWERKIFSDILKISVFLLLVFYIIFIFIDFTVHSAKIFSNSTTTIFTILKYYINLFFIELNIFLPLTILFSTIKVISEMNIHHELTALRMAGISSRLLSRPVLILAILFSCISYINLQFFYPGALNFKNNFKDTYIKKTKYKNLHPNVIYLNDNSKLVFQKFNRNKKKLFDVFFIKNNEDIYHAKYLDLNSSPPIGKFVDFLSRKDSYFEKINSFDEYEFTEINIQNGQYSLFIPYLNRSISMLLSQYKNLSFSKKDKIEILSYLNYKLAMPLLSVLLIIFVFPSLLHFSKNISIFFICAISIFGYIIFHTVMDSALILAENSLFSPYVIIWSPIVLSFYLGIRKYIKA